MRVELLGAIEPGDRAAQELATLVIVTVPSGEHDLRAGQKLDQFGNLLAQGSLLDLWQPPHQGALSPSWVRGNTVGIEGFTRSGDPTWQVRDRAGRGIQQELAFVE